MAGLGKKLQIGPVRVIHQKESIVPMADLRACRQIRQMPEFREGTKLAVVGSWQSPGFYNDHLEFTDYLMGVKGFLPSDYSACRFLEFYIGFPAVFASDAETEAIRQTEAFRNMNVYPYYGSVAVIDDTIVVKLSE